MSIAWGSLVLLVVLLPGVLFFVGLYFPEKFTRDAAERSALGQLAGTLLVSLVVHGVLYCLAPAICSIGAPCVDVGRFFVALTLERADAQTARALARDIEANRYWILGYLLLAALVGLLLGYLAGRRVVHGGLKFLTQHRWVYRLSLGDQLTTAWVLTHVRQDDRVVMYRGFLDSFHLKRDGTFSYVALTHVRKGYLILAPGAPTATPRGDWRTMGQSTRLAEPEEQARRARRYVESRFVIEGEDIANVTFDRYEVGFSINLRSAELEKAMRAALADLRTSTAETPIIIPGPVRSSDIEDRRK